MAQKILTTFLLLGLCISANAHRLSHDAAKAIAENFLNKAVKAHEMQTRAQEKTQAPTYYAFNAADAQGYVIVSADNRTRPILAYSDHGSLDLNNMPEACRMWLSLYEQQISSLSGTDTPSATEKNPMQADSPERIAPLLSTRWGQGYPYNKFCPIDEVEGKGERSSTGCIATAMAQIMYYHQWPRSGKGLISYSDSRQQNAERQLFLDTVPDFDWQHMRLQYAGLTTTEEEQTAVARLMLCAGYAARTQYSHGNSTSYERLGAIALFENFGYDSNIHRYLRAYTDDQQWTALLLHELKEGRPVLYTGFNASSGHTFVCDGYDGNGYFHFNWGWNGSSDGYFSLSALVPSQQQQGGQNGASYTFEQCMACGIQPPTADSRPQTDHLAATSLYISDGNQQYTDWTFSYSFETTSIGFRLLNTGVSDLNAEVCIGEQTANGITQLSDITSISLRSNYVRNTLLAIRKDQLAEGTHLLRPFYRQSGTNEWQPVPTPTDGIKAVSISAATGGHRLTAIHSNLHLRLSDSFRPGAFYANRQKTLSIPVINDGEATLSRLIGFRLNNSDGSYDQLFSTAAYCPVGDSTTVAIKADLQNVPAGDYSLSVFYCTQTGISANITPQNIEVIDTRPITVTAFPRINIEAQTAPYTLDLTTGDIEFQVFQPSGLVPWSGRIMGRISRGTSSSWDTVGEEETEVWLYSEYLELTKPSITKARLHADNISLPVGTDYLLTFYIDDENYLPMYSQRLSVISSSTGIPTSAPTRTVPVQTYDLQGRRIQPGHKGIRIIKDKYQVKKTIIR